MLAAGLELAVHRWYPAGAGAAWLCRYVVRVLRSWTRAESGPSLGGWESMLGGRERASLK